MLFTTNKPLTEWGEVLHDPDLASAILDRVLHHGRLLILDGPSVRNQEPFTGPQAGYPSAIFSGTSVPDLTEPTEDRCHLSLNKDCPEPRPVQPRPPGDAEVVAFPRVGGIHHRYEWKQAA